MKVQPCGATPHDDVAVREESTVDAFQRPFLDGVEKRVSTAPGLIERVAHLLAGSRPDAPSQLRATALHFKNKQAAVWMKDDEVGLAFAQRFTRKVAGRSEPRK